jgi:hypothetical protein
MAIRGKGNRWRHEFCHVERSNLGLVPNCLLMIIPDFLARISIGNGKSNDIPINVPKRNPVGVGRASCANTGSLRVAVFLFENYISAQIGHTIGGAGMTYQETYPEPKVVSTTPVH